MRIPAATIFVLFFIVPRLVTGQPEVNYQFQVDTDDLTGVPVDRATLVEMGDIRFSEVHLDEDERIVAELIYRNSLKTFNQGSVTNILNRDGSLIKTVYNVVDITRFDLGHYPRRPRWRAFSIQAVMTTKFRLTRKQNKSFGLDGVNVQSGANGDYVERKMLINYQWFPDTRILQVTVTDPFTMRMGTKFIHGTLEFQGRQKITSLSDERVINAGHSVTKKDGSKAKVKVTSSATRKVFWLEALLDGAEFSARFGEFRAWNTRLADGSSEWAFTFENEWEADHDMEYQKFFAGTGTASCTDRHEFGWDFSLNDSISNDIVYEEGTQCEASANAVGVRAAMLLKPTIDVDYDGSQIEEGLVGNVRIIAKVYKDSRPSEAFLRPLYRSAMNWFVGVYPESGPGYIQVNSPGTFDKLFSRKKFRRVRINP